MYYRLDFDDSVLDYSNTKYHKDCLYTEEELIRGWTGKLYIKGMEPPEPLDVKLARIQNTLTEAVQSHLDSRARSLGYDHCNSVCTYINTGIAKFDAEGEAFRKWRSAVWDKCYSIVAEVQEGSREIPSEEELIAELPKLEIIYG